MNSVTTRNKITIEVAHCLSTIRNADRIFVFLVGRMVEAGSHRELIVQGEMYTKMCEAQSLDTAI